jgi:beta-glucosidase
MNEIMRRILIVLLITFTVVLQNCKKESEMDSFIRNLMKKMTIEEKIGQLNLTISGGYVTGAAINDDVQKKIRAGQIGGILNSFSIESMRAMQELAINESPGKIPILFGMDVIHGFRTIFPIPLALSCTWDTDRIRTTARVAAREATANGICWTYSPMVDIARDPRWGRIAEGSGEDPWLGSQIAMAMVKGYQGDDLSANNTMMACVKHFALYGGAEAGRDYNTVDIGRVTMYNYWLPPYKAAIDAGAGSVMTSFNVVDGVPATGNSWLLTEILRNQWGFGGFVVTDYTSINEMMNHGMGDLQQVSALALRAGTDMDMVGEGFLTTLKKSLDEGSITENEINTACRRILEAKYKLGLFEDPFRYMDTERSKKETATPENLKEAREVAARSIVLLKNDKELLPLKKKGTIAVIGPLGDSKPDMLGTWAMGGDAENIVTVFAGIKNAAGDNAKILYAKGCELTDMPGMMNIFNPLGAQGGEEKKENKTAEMMLKEALALANQSDVVVAVLGESAAWSGEAASRSEINIPQTQTNLLKALLSTGKPVVLVLVNGRPLTLTWEDKYVPAIVEAWNGGSEAGNAIADVLFGDYNPSGKLTATFPRSVGQIPLYYNHLNTGRPATPENKFSSKYLDVPNEPLYPFGYGLSYTTFTYGDLKPDKTELIDNETLNVSVSVSNTGRYAGEEVVQLYIRDPVASISRPVKELKGFKKVLIKQGETVDVKFSLTTEELKFYNSEFKYDWEPGDYIIYIGTNSRDTKSVKVTWKK